MESKFEAIYKETVQRLTEIYGETEARSISNILFEDLHQISKTHRLTEPDGTLSVQQKENHIKALSELLLHKPIQQIIGHCFFYGKKLKVNEHTLIPRPETEELVDLIVKQNRIKNPKILDVGTGTGCIAISLASSLTGSLVHAWDISEEALELARENAEINQVKITFQIQDILSYTGEEKFDVIVSNPPYIPSKEKTFMAKNVIGYEPEKALFVPDDDPLLFYRKIAGMGKKNLTKNGWLYFEIHENFGAQMKSLLKSTGYENVTVMKDLQGKDRMLSARL